MTNLTQPIGSDDLNAFVDGSLTEGDQNLILTAVSAEPALAAELADLLAIRSILGGLAEYQPRRSFTLGKEFKRSRPTSMPPPRGKIVQLLPVIRSVSVAAVLLFMVIGGSLWMGVHGDTSNTSSQDFASQNSGMQVVGETESNAQSSEHAEDATTAPAAAGGSEQDKSSMTERGNSASADDRPSDDLTAEAAPSAPESPSNQPAPFTLSDHQEWVWATVVIGALAVAMSCVWLVLDRSNRQAFATNRR